MATAINAETGAQDGGGPLEVASEVEVSDNIICVADSTVPCDNTDGTVAEFTSGGEQRMRVWKKYRLILVKTMLRRVTSDLLVPRFCKEG